MQHIIWMVIALAIILLYMTESMKTFLFGWFRWTIIVLNVMNFMLHGMILLLKLV